MDVLSPEAEFVQNLWRRPVRMHTSHARTVSTDVLSPEAEFLQNLHGRHVRCTRPMLGLSARMCSVLEQGRCV